VKVPKWVRKYTARAKEALGLHSWTIDLQCAEQPNPNNPQSDACCEADPRYLFAILRFKPEHVAEPSEPAKVLILHELLHVVNSEHDEACSFVEHLLPRQRERTMARELLESADERRVVRLSRMLVHLIP
jgi:hypothetical protein